MNVECRMSNVGRRFAIAMVKAMACRISVRLVFIQFVFLGTMPSSVVLCNEWNRFALFRYVANMVLCFL